MSITRIKQAAAEADEMIKSLNQPTDEQEQEETPELATEDSGVAQEPTPTQDQGSGADWENEAKLWEQRYRSLNGMIQSRDRQIQQLHDLLAQMQQAKAEAPAQEAKSDSFLTPEDEEQYGADLVDMAKRAARQENAQLIEQLQGKIAQLENQLSGVSQATEASVRDRFESKLDRATNGEWRSIDADPKFIEWLKASQARYRVFVEGVREQDVSVVADFFQQYATMQQPAKSAANKTRSQLERQVAPGKSKATGTPQVQDKKQWTRTEIALVYANKKQYSQDEFNKLERDIAAAQREGRVDFNK